MAIDMTTVKQIMHNNKEVVKIEDGLGKVLWQKQAQPEWHTIYEDNSYWGTRILELSGENWTLGSVPANISDKATKLRITYNPYVSIAGNNADNYIKVTLNTSYNGQNPPDGNGTTVYPKNNVKRTDTFDYTQGNNIMHIIYSLDQVRDNYDWNYGWAGKANARWYQNGLASGYTGGN